MNRLRSRQELVGEFARVGRQHSDATILFHWAVARKMGLSPTDYKVMSLLERSGPLSAGEIASRTGLAAASVTDLINRLSAKGFVIRELDTLDRRRAVVRPVAAKMREVRCYFASTSESLARLVDEFGDDELDLIARFLQRNAERLSEETEKVECLAVMKPPNSKQD